MGSMPWRGLMRTNPPSYLGEVPMGTGAVTPIIAVYVPMQSSNVVNL